MLPFAGPFSAAFSALFSSPFLSDVLDLDYDESSLSEGELFDELDTS